MKNMSWPCLNDPDSNNLCNKCYNDVCYNKKNDLCAKCDIDKMYCKVCFKRVYNKDLSYWYIGVRFTKYANECVFCDEINDVKYCKNHLTKCDICDVLCCSDHIKMDTFVYHLSYYDKGNFCKPCYDHYDKYY